jgi:hypothetical protein
MFLCFLVMQCDLVPSWVTRGWLHVLSREFPTLAFHASVTNPYGKVSPFLYHLDCPSSTFASGFLPTFFCPQCPTAAFVQIEQLLLLCEVTCFGL